VRRLDTLDDEMVLIRKSVEADSAAMLAIVNDAAQALSGE